MYTMTVGNSTLNNEVRVITTYHPEHEHQAKFAFVTKVYVSLNTFKESIHCGTLLDAIEAHNNMKEKYKQW